MGSALLLLAASLAAAAGTNMLGNPGFEQLDGAAPAVWEAWGRGTVTPVGGGAHSGGRCVALFGGADLELLYQWAEDRVVPGAAYDFSLWARSGGGPAEAFVKLEFMDADGEKMQTTEAFGVTHRWAEYRFRRTAPETAVRVALTLGAGAGATVLYDDAGVTGRMVERSPVIAFDCARLAQRVGGFGVHHITAAQVRAAAEFANLHITHVRISQDWSSWEDLLELRRQSDAQGIKWLLVKWAPPKEMMGPDGALRDVAGYAKLWVDTVREFDRHGCRPEFLDLVNEPDYFGIPPAPYNELVKAVRRGLDVAGFREVGIAGPGLTHVGADNAKRYLDALDPGAVRSLAAWATHGWEDDSVADMDLRSAAFTAACRARDPGKPVWYTEYATASSRFHGVTYPNADNESTNYCASFTLAYAIRVYENTLALFNHGVEVPFYWDSEDGLNDRKQWGYIGPHGEKKPVYHALRAIYGEVRPGSRVVVPPPDPDRLTLYAGAFLDELDPGSPRVVVALANSSAETREAVVRLAHAPAGLSPVAVRRVEVAAWGDRERKIADEAKTTGGPVPLEPVDGGYEMRVRLGRDSALTVVLGRPAGGAGASGFVHPGALSSGEELDFVRAQARAGKQPWTGELDRLGRSGAAARGPHRWTKINSESGEAGVSMDDANAAYAQALLWSLTGDEACARRAIAILDAWSGLEGFTAGSGQDSLQAGWTGSVLANAAEIMRTCPGWSPAGVARLQAMFRRAFHPQLEAASTWNGNADLTQIDALLAIAVFDGDRAAFDLGIRRLRARVPAYVYLAAGPVPAIDGDGGNVPKFWSDPVRWVDGLTQETCRDNGHHAQFGLGSAIHAAEVAWHQGTDVYTEMAPRLVPALELLATQLLTGRMQGTCGNDTATGDLYDTWEIAYRHYHGRKGLALPQVRALIETRIRPNAPRAVLNLACETLTHAGE